MKKIISLILVIATIACCCSLLAACGKKDSNTIVMATNANFPPYEYKDGDNYVGIDIEIATEIAKKLGKTLKIEDVPFGSIVGGVESGKYDFGMAGMTVTEDRLKSVNFTTSYAKGIQSVIVPESSEYKSVDDFFNCDEEGNWVSVKDGVKIGVQQDTTGDIYASDEVKNFGFGEENVIRYPNGADAVLALTTGKVTAVIIDNEPAKAFVAANEGLVIMEGAYADEDYAIAIKKSNTDLLEQINQALDELTKDGTIQKIVDKYIK